MKNYNVGQINHLEIVRFTEHGAILDGGSVAILMPKKYTLAEQRPGDFVDVFVYLDQDDRLVATTETPRARVGEFAYLKVAWTNRYGAFMDWGLTKDLFVPFSEQRHHFMQGRNYLVYIYIDDRTGRIVGTSKLDRNLRDHAGELSAGGEVDIIFWKKTDLGWKVIVNHAYEGLVYDNEIFQPVATGQALRALVKCVRPDGKLDIALQPNSTQQTDRLAPQILDALHAAGGRLPLGDHSSADEIQEAFHASKKSFKRAIGALYKQHLIAITPDGIELVD